MKESAEHARVTLNEANKLDKSDFNRWSAASRNDAAYNRVTHC